MTEHLEGEVERIIFRNELTGFTIAKITSLAHKDPVTISGVMIVISPGETLSCQGRWEIHKTHGKQFAVSLVTSHPPSHLLGMQRYLESGLIHGIGPSLAEKIVQTFGKRTLEILEHSPDLLVQVDGIGKKKLDAIKRCWQEHRMIKDVMIFLQTHGVSCSLAQRIFRQYKEKSLEILQNDPFQVAKEIWGIGFKTADQIAAKLGMDPLCPKRLLAGTEFILRSLSEEGHLCFPTEKLAILAKEALGASLELIEETLTVLIQEKKMIQETIEGTSFIWLSFFYYTEKGIVEELFRLLDAPSPLRSINEEKAIEWVEQKLSIQLAKEQKTAILASFSNKVSIITGGPGTGKSTITQAILAIATKLTDKIVLAAPTGRAAKRLSQITRKRASTIHSLLEFDPSTALFKKSSSDPLDCECIILDEMSMVDAKLMYSLLKAIPSFSHIIFIGDVDQLPSVGPGQILKDMITSETIPTTRLMHIFRQSKGSDISTNAHLILKGCFPFLESTRKSDFTFIEAQTPEEVLEKITSLVSELAYKNSFDPFEDVQILAPMKRGLIGTENLNTALQKTLNPQNFTLSHLGRSFQMGDKVMQIRNNYTKNVFNGDIGRIIKIDLEEQLVEVHFDNKMVPYPFNELDELILAYAVSIHKYQGSESPIVIIPVHTTHFMMLYRNLLYTGVTRGKKRVYLVGSKKAIGVAIKNDKITQRQTHLQYFLKNNHTVNKS